MSKLTNPKYDGQGTSNFYPDHNKCKYYEKSLGVKQVTPARNADICAKNDVKNSAGCPFWKTYAP